MIFLFILISSSAVFAEDPYVCEGLHSVDPPKDILNPWFYPQGFTDTGTAPNYASNQNCSWKVNVPKGYYAFLTITSTTDIAGVSVTDSIGYTEWVPVSASREPYFILDNGGTVNLKSTTGGTFGLRVLWSRVGPFQPKNQNVLPNAVPLVLSSGAFDNGTVIMSASRVSLLSLPPPPMFTDLANYMRNTVVYDGENRDAKLLGNLWQLYNSNNHIVSSGKYITLYSLHPDIMLNNYILLQDYNNVKQFSTYKGVSCFSSTLCGFSIDARNGTGGAVRMSGSPHYLREVDMQNTSTLSVYTGPILESNKLGQYSYNQISTHIPQKFNGLFTTYVLDKNIGIFYLTNDVVSSKYNNVYEGRQGFFASKNYQTLSSDQNLSETLSGSSSENYKITANVKEFGGLTGSSALTVTIVSQGNTVSEMKYNVNQLPNAVISAIGNSLSVKYDTDGSITTGVYVEFSFEKTSGSVGLGIFLSLLITIGCVTM